MAIPFSLDLRNLPEIGIARSPARTVGPSGIPLRLDFTTQAEQVADLSTLQNRAKFGAVCGIYVDNRANAAALRITANEPFLQSMEIPAGAQAYMPMITTATTRLTFATTAVAALIVPVQLLNFVPAPYLWSASASTPSGSVTIVPTRGAITERNGFIAAGGVSQTLMAANPARSYLLIQNPTTAAGQNIGAAEALYIRFAAGAGINAGTSFELAAGGSYEMQGPFINTGLIAVNATTINHRYIAGEG